MTTYFHNKEESAKLLLQHKAFLKEVSLAGNVDHVKSIIRGASNDQLKLMCTIAFSVAYGGMPLRNAKMEMIKKKKMLNELEQTFSPHKYGKMMMEQNNERALKTNALGKIASILTYVLDTAINGAVITD